MCACVFYNNGYCSYEDYASGKTEDSYCGHGAEIYDEEGEETGEEVNCDSFSEEDENEDEEE